ncbi:UNVERIFIED_ORG: hypothetical protein J2Y93_002937 [Pantoea agglomerans]
MINVCMKIFMRQNIVSKFAYRTRINGVEFYYAISRLFRSLSSAISINLASAAA